MSKGTQRVPLVTALAALLACTALQAQVGHPPGSSPYRDLRLRYAFAFDGGYALGSGGRVDVGPSSGLFGGVRLDLHLAGPTNAVFGVAYGQFERVLLHPDSTPDTRNVGTVKQSVVLADVGVDLVLTGAKTWHGFAPYVGAGLGIALGRDVPNDPSGFDFSTKFMIGPRIGTQWHPTRRIMFRIEARDMLWRLRYPAWFFEGSDPVLDPNTVKYTEWTHNPMFVFSVGYTFRR